VHFEFIHSFITEIYIAPLQGNYSEELPTLARLKRTVLNVGHLISKTFVSWDRNRWSLFSS